MPEIINSCEYISLTKPENIYPCERNFSENLLPSAPGIYMWFFKNNPRLPQTIFDGCVAVKDYRLLYIGIASKSLKNRIKSIHMNGTARRSTLRYSLGALQTMQFQKLSRRKYRLANEQELSDWLKKSAAVSWISYENPSKLEKQFIQNRQLNFPLNIQHNSHHPFCKDLKAARSNARKKANRGCDVQNQCPGSHIARRAYPV